MAALMAGRGAPGGRSCPRFASAHEPLGRRDERPRVGQLLLLLGAQTHETVDLRLRRGVTDHLERADLLAERLDLLLERGDHAAHRLAGARTVPRHQRHRDGVGPANGDVGRRRPSFDAQQARVPHAGVDRAPDAATQGADLACVRRRDAHQLERVDQDTIARGGHLVRAQVDRRRRHRRQPELREARGAAHHEQRRLGAVHRVLALTEEEVTPPANTARTPASTAPRTTKPTRSRRLTEISLRSSFTDAPGSRVDSPPWPVGRGGDHPTCRAPDPSTRS